MNRYCAAPVEDVAECDGWVLCSMPEDDSDGFTTTNYIARGPEVDRLLGISRFQFSPTQERFDWLVRSGFPRCAKGSWTDAEIDAELARSPRLAA